MFNAYVDFAGDVCHKSSMSRYLCNTCKEYNINALMFLFFTLPTKKKLLLF